MTELMKTTDRNLRPWDPFAEMERLRSQLFEAPNRWITPWTTPFEGRFVPPADIEETDKAWIVDVELPGVDKKDVEVEVHGRTVVISGERREKERRGVLREKRRITGTFRYEVTLPSEFEDTAVEATLTDGELTLRVPKTEADQPHKIKVN